MLQVQPLHVAGTSEREEVREEISYRNATAYKKRGYADHRPTILSGREESYLLTDRLRKPHEYPPLPTLFFPLLSPV